MNLATENYHVPSVQRDFEELYKRFDKVSFGISCRTIEMHAVYGNQEAAIAELKRFLRLPTRCRVTLETLLVDCVEVRTSTALELANIYTLADYKAADDRELRALPNMGPRTIKKLDDMLARIERQEIEYCNFGLSEDEQLQLHYSEEPLTPIYESKHMNHTTEKPTVSDAISALLENSDESIAEIDAKIESATNELAKLKKMRKFLAGSKAGAPSQSIDPEKWKDKIDAVRAFLQEYEPSKVKVISDHTGFHPLALSRLVANYHEFYFDDDKLVHLAETKSDDVDGADVNEE